MSATNAQKLALRQTRSVVKHSLGKFRQTRSSQENTSFGPEYVACCRHCSAYVIVYFPFTKDEAEKQGITDLQTAISKANGHKSKTLFSVGGNHERKKCNDQM